MGDHFYLSPAICIIDPVCLDPESVTDPRQNRPFEFFEKISLRKLSISEVETYPKFDQLALLCGNVLTGQL
jgi:hypothetical protein